MCAGGQVWVCLLEPALPAACGGGGRSGDGWYGSGAEEYPDMPCYTFDETANAFAFWGRNTVLHLLSATQMRVAPVP